jgi:hypothetical protein
VFHADVKASVAVIFAISETGGLKVRMPRAPIRVALSVISTAVVPR